MAPTLSKPEKDNAKLPFKCKHCKRGFRSPITFRRHIRTEQCDLGPHHCKCGKSFDLLSYLKRHQTTSLCSNDRWQCPTCNVQRVKSARYTHKCQILNCGLCTFSTSNKFQFTAHEKNHAREEKLVCEICFMEMPSKHRLREHMRTNHSANYARHYTCQECLKIFDYGLTLKVHQARVHSNATEAFMAELYAELGVIEIEGVETTQATENVEEAIIEEWIEEEEGVEITQATENEGNENVEEAIIEEWIEEEVEEVYACHVCALTFSSETNLNRHIRASHR